jgi:tripartite-type tricarboxylate transporter receptor subunit TctC
MYISSGAGGLNDTYGRLLAEYLPRHLPGNPKILPKNMPGAGSLKATKFLYTQAPRDGSAMGVVQRSVATQPLLGIKGADHNPLEFNWIGSTASEVSVAVVWNFDKVKTIQDAMKQEVTVGASGVGNDGGAFPRVVNYFLGTKVRPIHGYVSGTDIILALERGEVHGRFGWSWGSVKSREAERVKNGTIKVLLQMGLKKAPDLNAPLILDLAKNETDRKAMEVIFAATTIGWPSLLPPKVPADMVKAYRDAYKATMKDAKFTEAANKRRLELDPVTGEEIQAIIANVYAASPEVIQRARVAYSPSGKVEMTKILKVDGTIEKINKKRSRMTLAAGSKKIEGRIAGATKITIKGKKAERRALGIGMSCTISLVSSGAVVSQMSCK